jgi:hypothetical protein
MIIEWSRYLALILMLLAVVYGYRKGRNASVVSGQSLAWTNIPLIALAIISIGPSIYAVILYLTYRFGLVQPHAPGYSFGSFVYFLPVDFALINWAFVPLYVVCRCSACDVVFCSCDVCPRCSFIWFGAGNGFQRLR